MKQALLQITTFLIVNIVGAFIIPFMVHVGIAADIITLNESEKLRHALLQWLTRGTGFWIFCALASLTFFFFDKKIKKRTALFLPLYGPFLYSLAMFAYFAAH